MNAFPKRLTPAQEHKEIKKMWQEYKREERRAALLINAYALLIWGIVNMRKL